MVSFGVISESSQTTAYDLSRWKQRFEARRQPGGGDRTTTAGGISSVRLAIRCPLLSPSHSLSLALCLFLCHRRLLDGKEVRDFNVVIHPFGAEQNSSRRQKKNENVE